MTKTAGKVRLYPAVSPGLPTVPLCLAAKLGTDSVYFFHFVPTVKTLVYRLPLLVANQSITLVFLSARIHAEKESGFPAKAGTGAKLNRSYQLVSKLCILKQYFPVRAFRSSME